MIASTCNKEHTELHLPVHTHMKAFNKNLSKMQPISRLHRVSSVLCTTAFLIKIQVHVHSTHYYSYYHCHYSHYYYRLYASYNHHIYHISLVTLMLLPLHNCMFSHTVSTKGSALNSILLNMEWLPMA